MKPPGKGKLLNQNSGDVGKNPQPVHRFDGDLPFTPLLLQAINISNLRMCAGTQGAIFFQITAPITSNSQEALP